MIKTNKLNELEICILVAKIEGHKVTSDSISHNLVPCAQGSKHSGIIPVNDEGKHLTAFDPIQDDALCYQLMLKYDIKLTKQDVGSNDECYIAMYSHCRGEKEKNPNKAICMAIIALNKAA